MTNTSRSFSAMLNEYLPNKLLREELIKRDWLLNNVEKDDSWKGGNLVVPFEASQASSVKFGGLTASSDIAEDDFQRGNISAYVEVWGAMKFNHADLMQHNKMSEQSFLQILPGRVERFIEYMKEVISVNMLGAAYFAAATGDGQAGGTIVVDHIDRFVLGQKVTLDDANSAQGDYYVTAITLDSNTVTLSASRGGAAADISAYTVAQSARFYHEGVLVAGTVTNRFASLRDSLLSAANGGSAALYGKTKTAYPYLQAINVSGTTVSAANILDKLFDGYTAVRTKARGNANKILMSFKHLGSIMKLVETQKSAFKVSVNSTKASLYGWTELEITSVKGSLTLIGIQEMDDDIIIYLDLSAVKFYSNGMFQKRKSPDGKEYFEDRAVSGFSYIVDVSLFGELVVNAPSRCGIMYGIPAY